jgi:hypothetical protein
MLSLLFNSHVTLMICPMWHVLNAYDIINRLSVHFEDIVHFEKIMTFSTYVGRQQTKCQHGRS